MIHLFRGKIEGFATEAIPIKFRGVASPRPETGRGSQRQHRLKGLLAWIIHKINAQNTYLFENIKGKIKKPYEE
jgi:hypothetical protein